MLARARGDEGEVPRGRRGARPRAAARHGAGRGPARRKEPLDKEVTRALYQECLRRGLVAMTYCADRPASIRRSIIREDKALAGLAILDEALDAVAPSSHGLRRSECSAARRHHRPRQRGACTATCPAGCERPRRRDRRRHRRRGPRGAPMCAERLPGRPLVRLRRGPAGRRRVSTSWTSARRRRATRR